MALAQLYQFPKEEAMAKAPSVRRPSFQFYPGDWRRDPALRTCSMAAKGLWIELMCVMHESEEYGFLVVAGKAMDERDIAKIIGETPTFCKKIIKELEEKFVFSRDSRGAIYSRRMVKDESIRTIRAAAGSLGGNPKLKGDLVKQKVKQTGKQNPTPSSSSSSSSSISSVTDVTDGRPSKAPKITDPKEIIFGYGVSMLVNAGTSDKQARTFLGGLVKTHGEAELVNKLRECAQAKPLQPLTWLAAAMPPPKQATSKQEKLEQQNQQVGEEWEREMLAQSQVMGG